MAFSTSELLDYLRRARLATVSSIGPDGAPQSALVGIGVTDDLRIIFDTMASSRKHANLTRDPRVSIVVGGPDEQALQYEGRASPVSVTDPADAMMREA